MIRGLGRNSLTSLPESFGNLKALTHLLLQLSMKKTYIHARYLNMNSLASLPESIGSLTALKSL